MDTLVTIDWLSRHLDEPDLVVLDCSLYQRTDDSDALRNERLRRLRAWTHSVRRIRRSHR